MTFSNFTLIFSLECTDDKENKIVNNIAMNFININLVKSLLIPLLFTISFNTSAKDELEVGNMAPDFSLVDQNSKTHTLSEYKGSWVVIYFYPKDDTPGCTKEACEFRDNIEIINKLKAKVFGISLDDTESHKKFAEKYSLPFPLLSDNDGKVAEKYDSFGSFVGFKYASRHTFIINPSGEIHKIYKSVNPSTHAKEIIKELELNINS